MKRHCVTMTFTGALNVESFIAFVRHRAARLDLDLAILAVDRSSATVAVAGQLDLVDAFDMACSLGPHDCMVLDVTQAEASPALFESRNEGKKE